MLRTEMRPENFYCLLQILTTNCARLDEGGTIPEVQAHPSRDARPL